MADEGVDEAVAFGGDFDLHGAAVAGGCCCAVFVAVGAVGWEVDFVAHCVWLQVFLDRGKSCGCLNVSD